MIIKKKLYYAGHSRMGKRINWHVCWRNSNSYCPSTFRYQKYNFKLSHFYSILLNLTKYYSIVLNPPHLGYGDEGSSGIPGGATLHFTVDLRAVAKGKLKIKTEEQKRRERDYF